LSTLADTDVLIDYLRDQPSAVELLEPLFAAGSLAASVITKAELVAGARRGQSSQLIRLFAVIAWLPVTNEIAVAAGALWQEFRRADVRGVLADYLIAATAQVFAARLLTRNVRHFPMFPGLAAPYGIP
jgi:predicted nucleic acid-binding protein